jgi:3-isopropylmalate dehydrogenase
LKARLAIIEGDGVGPEVVRQGVKALEAVAARFNHQFEMQPVSIGFNAWRSTGSALSQEAIELCRASDGILLGATGPADHEYTRPDAPPGWGRRQLSRELGLCASVRPIRAYPQTAGVSPIRSERIEQADLVIVRDMTLVNRLGLHRSGQTPSGRFAEDTLAFDEPSIQKTLRFAFLLAQSRNARLCLATQSSMYATSRLWLSIFTEIGAEFPGVSTEVQAPDNCAMQLIRNPSHFDVIVTESTPMGGMLNNLAAMINGSIGMAPGTTIALKEGTSYTAMVERSGLYEPIHGSAPRRAGQDLVNPIGTVLAAAMLLRYSLSLEAEAVAVEHAVASALDGGYRTYDIMEPKKIRVGTEAMGDRIAAAIGAPVPAR